jgi:hypothetical protein
MVSTVASSGEPVRLSSDHSESELFLCDTSVDPQLAKDSPEALEGVGGLSRRMGSRSVRIEATWHSM